MNDSIVPIERIENYIYIIRGLRVMLDRDLAQLYGVETRALIQAVKRNPKRFPEDFMFELSWEEAESLRSQIVILDDPLASGRGRYTKYRPRVFTEHGVVMVANVLRSERAALMSIQVVRAFIRLRQILSSHQTLIKEFRELKSFFLKYSHRTDQEFRKVWHAIEKLQNPPPLVDQPRIGFRLD